MRELLVFIAISCIASPTTSAQEQRGATTHSAAGETRDLVLQLFHGRGTSLVIDGAGAHFRVQDGGEKFRLGHPRDDDWRANFVSEFTVSKPGDVFWWPSHHGSVIFSVKEIRDHKLVVRYETSSFAQEDSGEITLVPFSTE